MAIVGSLVPWIDQQFHDANGLPLAGGQITAYATGTTTPQDTYSDAGLTTPNTNPIILDSAGRPPVAIFLGSNGYDFVIADIDGNVIDTIEGIENSSAAVISALSLATGAAGVTSGYTIQATDFFVTVSSSGGPNPCVINLPPAADRTLPITIKNQGNIPVALTPNGAETIDSASPYTLPASSGAPNYPTIVLLSNGVLAYFVQAGVGVF